jgi:membrane associated rhomboid family serine protease
VESETQAPDGGDAELSGLVEVGRYASTAAGFEHGLVALASGCAFWLLPVEGGFRLVVARGDAEHVRGQLARFDRESVGWPPRPEVERAPAHRTSLFTPLLWALAVLASFWAQRIWPAWTASGAVDARAMFGGGEWWRAGTALFLHADVGHLVSNLLSGIFAFYAVVATMGRRRGWVLLAVAAVAGNMSAAALHPGGEYRSLGASTAVFAALGLLTGRATRVMLRLERRRRWRALFVPAAAGVTVLALYGAGEQRVDVLAHFTGFLTGVVLGAAFGTRANARSSR